MAFTARPKIHSHSQIFRYGGSIFCLPHRPIFSDIFDLCLHWVSVVRDIDYWGVPKGIFLCKKHLDQICVLIDLIKYKYARKVSSKNNSFYGTIIIASHAWVHPWSKNSEYWFQSYGVLSWKSNFGISKGRLESKAGFPVGYQKIIKMKHLSRPPHLTTEIFMSISIVTFFILEIQGAL